MADWSNLPQELLVSIANRIPSMADYIGFGAVCKSWSSAGTKKNFTGPLMRQVPVLIHREDRDAVAGMRECYSLTKYKIHKLDLPEAKGKVCCSCSGWLITISCTHVRNLELKLLHPFNHSQIKLPGFKDSNGKLYPANMSAFHRNKKFVLSSNPSWTSDYTIMVHYEGRELAFCKRRDDEYWTTIRLEKHPRDIAYYKGRFYAVDYNGGIVVCNIEDPKKPKTSCCSRGAEGTCILFYL